MQRLVDNTSPNNTIKSTTFGKMVANDPIITTILGIENEMKAIIDHTK